MGCNCEYVKEHYGVPAEIGAAVIAYGEPGVIAEDRGHHIGILLDKDKPGNVDSYHPTDGIEYTGQVKMVRKLTRKQRIAKARYQRYLDFCDCFDSFIDFCYWDQQQERREK
jgi:hypothetical protein